jgi:hypothetical protein
VRDANGPRGSGHDASACSAFRHLLAAVHEALNLPAPDRTSDRASYLDILEQRAFVARASLARIVADPRSGELDYQSEGDHILHQIADLPPGTYRHAPPERS